MAIIFSNLRSCAFVTRPGPRTWCRRRFWRHFKGGDKFFRSQCREELVVGILKNKICDHYRKAGRETSFTDLEFYWTRRVTASSRTECFRAAGFTN